ncbi:hypothetical protein QQ045_015769 [Rhodiola kirilowii]
MRARPGFFIFDSPYNRVGLNLLGQFGLIILSMPTLCTEPAVLALIPKSKTASEPADYRPIACFNVTYKVISGLLAERLKTVLPGIIDKAQGAFVQGRSIVSNVCLAQQIVSGYGRKNSSEKMAWKIDLRKAYDTVDW